MTIEPRLEQLEKRNKRLTVALTMTVVAMAAVVTMAATGEKRGVFDMVVARTIFVKNDAGKVVVGLGANDDGDGLVETDSAKGKELVALGSNPDGGRVWVNNKTGESIASMSADEYGNGDLVS